MGNKLLIGAALLAAGIAITACQKTPGGEPGAETQNKSSPQRSEAKKQPDQSANRSARENEQESKQAQREAEQSQPNGGEGAQTQDRGASQSETSGQSARDALQQKQGQPNQPQQSQVQQGEPQQNQPRQNEQNGNGTAGRTVHLSREQIRQAQSVLKQKGFDVGVIDGIFGPATRKALIAFQQQQGLHATGQMDEGTVAALGIASSTTTGRGGPSPIPR